MYLIFSNPKFIKFLGATTSTHTCALSSDGADGCAATTVSGQTVPNSETCLCSTDLCNPAIKSEISWILMSLSLIAAICTLI